MLLQVGFLRHCLHNAIRSPLQFYALASLAPPLPRYYLWRPNGTIVVQGPVFLLSLRNNNHHFLPLLTTIAGRIGAKNGLWDCGAILKRKIQERVENSLQILCFCDEIKIHPSKRREQEESSHIHPLSWRPAQPSQPTTKWLAITGIQWINGRKTSRTKLPGELHKQTEILRLVRAIQRDAGHKNKRSVDRSQHATLQRHRRRMDGWSTI